MAATSIQRIVEQQAAIFADRTAVDSRDGAITYRQLNQHANALARHLIASGFRRGGYAVVCMPRGIDLAAVLLAILKAGGSYTWFDPIVGGGFPPGVSIRVSRQGGAEQFLHVDVSRPTRELGQAGPNLPIVTRGSDIACVLPDTDGAPAVLVPHGTVTSLVGRAASDVARWDGAAGALDLWLGLMSGATIVLDDQAQAAAA